jgi:hypothetical protein
MSTANREEWIVTNIHTTPISLGRICPLAIAPGKTIDILARAGKEAILQSKDIKSLLEKSWITICKKIDGLSTEVVTSPDALAGSTDATSVSTTIEQSTQTLTDSEGESSVLYGTRVLFNSSGGPSIDWGGLAPLFVAASGGSWFVELDENNNKFRIHVTYSDNEAKVFELNLENPK